MRTIKPQKLGILTKVFESGPGSYHLVVTSLAFFSFDPEAPLGLEADLWKMAAEELGKEGVLDLAMPKPRGEVLVTGKAYPRGGPRPACSVRLKLGPIDKTLYVVGDRWWAGNASTEPRPFTEMPITYENAFGGNGYAPNPVGKGIAPIKTDAGEVHPLPNVEDPNRLVKSPKDRPPPMGFGGYDLMWPQRFSKIGTYDDQWLKERFPAVAADFDLGFYNAAPADQQIQGHFQGDEAFSIENMHPTEGLIEGRLPGIKARTFVNQKGSSTMGPQAAPNPEGETFRELSTRLDTVHLFPHRMRGILIFRGMIPVAEDDAADVLQVIAAFEDEAAPRPVDHYRTVLAQRLDKKKAHLYLLRDVDLVPARSAPPKNRPDGMGDMADLLAKEDVFRKNMRRRVEREIEKGRAALRAQNVDPDKHVPRELPPDEVPDMDELPALMDRLNAELEEKKVEAEKKRAEAEEEARKACARQGLDYDKILADHRKKAGGPPKFSADVELERLRDQKRLADNAGVSLPHVEQKLADPQIEEKLRKAEQALKDAYRKFAHHFPPAAPLEGDARARARAEIEATLAAGGGLAGADYTGADLSKLDLKKANLCVGLFECADFSGTDLAGADLTGAVLARADLRGANLAGAKLMGANLGGARLAGATLAGADLTGAVLAKADLTNADVKNAQLGGADLSEAIFTGADFTGVTAPRLNFLDSDLSGLKLAGADLTRCNFLNTSIAGCDLSGAKLVSAVLYGVTGDGTSFRGADLENLRVVLGASFEKADFAGARMPKANLRGSNLSGCNLEGADLTGSDLSECDLRGARLHRIRARDSRWLRADLRGANLVGADLMQSILQKAKLGGADLTGANLFRADLLRVEVDRGTVTKDANLTQIRFVEARRQHDQG